MDVQSIEFVSVPRWNAFSHLMVHLEWMASGALSPQGNYVKIPITPRTPLTSEHFTGKAHMWGTTGGRGTLSSPCSTGPNHNWRDGRGVDPNAR